MRKFVLALVAGAAAVVAIPASATAQYYSAPPGAYGFHGDWNATGALQGRIDNIRRQIDRLDRRDEIRGRSADRLLGEASKIERRLHDKARNGLDAREVGDIEYRIERLEQRVQFAVNDRFGRYAYRWQ